MSNLVQTPSGYHVLFANSTPAKWALSHQLVLSQCGYNPILRRRKDQFPFSSQMAQMIIHVLVTQYSSSQLAGKTIPCHVRCKMGQTHKENHSKGVHISCHRCGARTTVKLFRLDEKMVLGKHALRWVTPGNLPHNVGVRMYGRLIYVKLGEDQAWQAYKEGW